MERLESIIKQLRAFNIHIAKVIDGKKLHFKRMPKVHISWYKLWIQLYLNEAKLKEINIPQPLMIEITLALLEDE